MMTMRKYRTMNHNKRKPFYLEKTIVFKENLIEMNQTSFWYETVLIYMNVLTRHVEAGDCLNV